MDYNSASCITVRGDFNQGDKLISSLLAKNGDNSLKKKDQFEATWSHG